MTSTTGTAQHPDVSEIADLTEGVLPPTRQAAVRRHLEGCELCSDVRASLEEIRGLLGTLPGPQRMPADIAGRIDAALAAEALLDATAPDDEPINVSRETESAPQPSEPRSDRPSGHARASTGPGRGPSSRRRRRVTLVTAAFSAAAVGLSALLLQTFGGTSGDTSEKKADTAASAVSGGHDFTAATLPARVDSLLSSSGTPKDSGSWTATGPRVEKDASVGAEATPLRSPAVPVPPCIQKGTGRTDAAIAVDKGTFEGTPAFLVVLPHSEDASRVQAYVVAATCVETAPTGKGELLVTQAYPRP
ncbi:anti-sigma factor [Streptomyces wuyuanensis]|uniref:Zinc-finger n=1 Tax=Streptomyces wuyuanensis TaxID=1196353 RepID=A0A1G9UK37_9ACTN|nr:hypothetical protein [Streptomyces wuyuanensis]SDM60292.1 hypothetical protein SAMN05444921_110206 [Streptomyces wuyuanensis]